MKSYEHISKMETILDDHQALIDQLEALLKAFSEHQKEYRQLADYYSSQQFLTDFDEANTLDFPKDIKCGVLSEDAVFNLLTKTIRSHCKCWKSPEHPKGRMRLIVT